MSKFEKVKIYYENKLWTINMVRNAIEKGWITEEEFEQIVSN